MLQTFGDLAIRETGGYDVGNSSLGQVMLIMASMLVHDLFQLIRGGLCSTYTEYVYIDIMEKVNKG